MTKCVMGRLSFVTSSTICACTQDTSLPDGTRISRAAKRSEVVGWMGLLGAVSLVYIVVSFGTCSSSYFSINTPIASINDAKG